MAYNFLPTLAHGKIFHYQAVSQCSSSSLHMCTVHGVSTGGVTVRQKIIYINSFLQDSLIVSSVVRVVAVLSAVPPPTLIPY